MDLQWKDQRGPADIFVDASEVLRTLELHYAEQRLGIPPLFEVRLTVARCVGNIRLGGARWVPIAKRIDLGAGLMYLTLREAQLGDDPDEIDRRFFG